MELLIVYFVLLAAAFFFLIVRPRRRQLAARQALASSLELGDDVITAGGIYGTVRDIDEATIMLEVADGVVIRVAREAILGRPRVATEGVSDPGADAGPAEPED
jgi:preprotein translocase subunit YajC